MSFIHSLKRAFGLGENFEAEDIDADDSPEVATAAEPATPYVEAKLTPPGDSSLSADIFECVVQLFNTTQPEFVKTCLDTEAQKAFILGQLDSALKQRLEKEVENARLHGQNLWAEERARLGSEVESLKKEKESLEQKRDESKTARLSAERQKRALIERVHDLETQLLTVEAEKEQYVLENRSMLNKLRVASVTSAGASDDVVEQISSLSAENTSLKEQIQASADEAAHFKAISTTHTLVFEMLLDKISTLCTALAEKEQALIAADDDLTAIEEAKEHFRLAEEALAKKDKRIESLKATQEQDIKEIAELTRLNREKDARIAELANEIKSLNDTIARNLADNARMMEEKNSRPKSRKSKHRQESKPRISAIDELLDGTDWLVSAPPPPAPKDPDKEDDFGYKAPQRKINLDEDKQLSLW